MTRSFGAEKTLYRSVQDAIHNVKNVFCVGRNYTEHAQELGNDVPAAPLIFGKPTRSLTPATGVVQLPEGRTNIHHELEIVLWIGSPYEKGKRVTDVVGGVALGLDLTDRDTQTRLKQAGQPWELAKGFKNSGILSDFYVVKDWGSLLEAPFTLRKNGQNVQNGYARHMIFSFETLLAYVTEHFGMAEGDILYTGTPAGVGPVNAGDRVQFLFDGQEWADFRFS